MMGQKPSDQQLFLNLHKKGIYLNIYQLQKDLKPNFVELFLKSS
jgi:hypothetical protein